MQKILTTAIIERLVDQETRAWDNQDVDLLLDLIHPDMVWPWPPTNQDHNPVNWIMGFGRFDHDRWRTNWQGLFDDFELVHNHRQIVTIKVSEQQDGGFAVVDIDTLWRHRQTGEEDHWRGRVCKIYTKVDNSWKLIAHTGVLDYSGL